MRMLLAPIGRTASLAAIIARWLSVNGAARSFPNAGLSHALSKGIACHSERTSDGL